MSRMRSSMSKKNKWYIDPERYLELKHFCLQFDSFKNDYFSSITVNGSSYIRRFPSRNERFKRASLVETTVEYLEDRNNKMDMIIKCAKKADRDIYSWILKGVTKGLGYEELRARGIPCGKDYYYEAYHKFFYILDKERK